MLFDMVMLICFGLSWPAAIIKTVKSKTVKGASILMYVFVFIGYVSGVFFKIFYRFDLVIIAYLINTLMVGIQIVLYFYYGFKEKKMSTKAEK